MSLWQERVRALPEESRLCTSGLHPVLARLYASRGIGGAAELRLEASCLSPGEGPQGLRGLAEAAALLATAVQQQRAIMIVGDYDCDGATATALLVEALRLCGARNLAYMVPDRFRWGYGLSSALVDHLPAGTEVLVTVDNGISSTEGIALARERGIQVIVTDHHLPGDSLPDAHAIVNPQQPGCPFPWKSTAGVGVAFYLAAAVRARLLESGAFSAATPPHLGTLWDLVALGTVADVVPMEWNNRILVRQGLERLRRGRGRTGLQVLMELAGLDPATVTAASLAFAIAPRINAAGRLEDMRTGIRLLLETDLEQARSLAEELDALNRQRRDMEEEMGEEAGKLLASAQECAHNFGLCVYQPHWHAGIIGIVAGRLRERHHRPVFVFAPLEDGYLQGSGRSILGLHLRDSLGDVATRYPGLLDRFGGHAMAAGLRLKEEDLPRFHQCWEEVLRERLDVRDLEARVEYDGELADGDLDLVLVRLLESAGPWGNRFPEPLFRGIFRVREHYPLSGGHCRYVLETPGGKRLDGIQFRAAGTVSGTHVEALYVPEINRFRGRERLQLRLQALRGRKEEEHHGRNQ